MKAQLPQGSSESAAASASNSAVPTPDTASIASTDNHTEVGTQYGEGSSTLESSDETLHASNASVKSGSSSKGKGKTNGSSKRTPQEDATTPDKKAKHTSNTDNLVGKLNNLVTTDLSNIVEGRDFPLLCEYTGSLMSAYKTRLISFISGFLPSDAWHWRLVPLYDSRLEVSRTDGWNNVTDRDSRPPLDRR